MIYAFRVWGNVKKCRVYVGELRRFTKSEATITTILTANLPFGSSALDVFRLPGPPQADLGRQRASRARTNDRKTSLPFIASGFTLRFSLLCCDEWWVPKWYWESQLRVPSAPGCFSASGLSLGSGASLSARRVGLQVTMDNGGGALQGTGVCVARAPYGVRCHPCPRRISRSPRRGCFIAPADRIRYETGRGTCAPGAPASPAGAVPPSACRSTSGCVQNPVWACPGRRFVPVPRMSVIYDSQQGLSRHKQHDELNALRTMR
jgi:hypothetical protein